MERITQNHGQNNLLCSLTGRYADVPQGKVVSGLINNGEGNAPNAIPVDPGGTGLHYRALLPGGLGQLLRSGCRAGLTRAFLAMGGGDGKTKYTIS